ncbi:MAG: class I SAM-dependent methyltransferase [Pseudomonadota bacterium]
MFTAYTAETLWTQPHLAKKMLELHLSQDTALASRPFVAIDRVIDWIDQSFGLDGKSVCDLGCGPGLYTKRYAERGAIVHGLDFSRTSIDYARKHAPSNVARIAYQVADYLKDPLPENQDLVTLIYCDLCPLSPVQRQELMSRVHHALSPGGGFIFDVFSIKAFETVVERVSFERNLMNGFWSAHDYFAFQSTFRYERDAVSLDRFTIIEEDRTWDVYNWLKYFSCDEIRLELKQAGFDKVAFTNGFGVDPSDETTFGVIATR